MSKPPLGLTPRFIWIEQRKQDIIDAVRRYTEANKEIPTEWINEYNEILKLEKADWTRQFF